MPATCSRPDAVQRTIDAVRPEAIAHLAAVTHIHGTSLADYAAQRRWRRVPARRRSREMARCERVVCTSTQLVNRVGHRPRADDDYEPTTVYGESKVRTEQIWRQADGGGTTWCLVRPTTIWGPGMNPHYLRFFGMIRRGRYVHVGRDPVRKTYGFVGNTIHQYRGSSRRRQRPCTDGRSTLATTIRSTCARGPRRSSRTGRTADPDRPVPVARSVAAVGDGINAIGFDRFPFNSFRLRNVLTPSVVDLSATETVCGSLPYAPAEGIAQTAAWLRDTWSGSSVVPRILLPDRAIRDA